MAKRARARRPGVAALPWPGVARVVLCRALVGLVIGLGLGTLAPIPFGFDPATVMSGSMEPRVPVGSVALTRPIDPASLEVGQVISFDSSDEEPRRILHRIVEITDEGHFVTKGDANGARDGAVVEPEQIQGLGRILVPFLGYPVVWIAGGQWVQLGLAVTAAALVTRGAFVAPLVPGRGPREALVVLAAAGGTLAASAVLAGYGEREFGAFTAATTTDATWTAGTFQSDCEISYTATKDPGSTYLEIYLFIHNRTDTQIPASWVLTFTFLDDEVIGSTDGPTWVQNGQSVELTGGSWQPIPADGELRVIINADTTAANPQTPTDFMLNGTQCPTI